MRAAVVDLGTNTFELLIADIDQKGDWTPLISEEVPVFLGKGGIQKNHIAEEAQKRALECLVGFSDKIKKAQCAIVKCTATSALRNADNSSAVIEKIFDLTGLKIDVISGEQEATFIAKGTALAMVGFDNAYLVMDIGGGSTEFVLMKNENVLFKRSIELGATRLLEEHGLSDPPSTSELEGMKKTISTGFAPIVEVLKKHSVNTLVGGSGTFDTFKAMMNLEERNAIAEYNIEELIDLLNTLISSDRSARISMPGLIEFRVDTMIPSALMVQYFLKAGIEKVLWSGYALKEGIMQEIAEEIAPA